MSLNNNTDNFEQIQEMKTSGEYRGLAPLEAGDYFFTILSTSPYILCSPFVLSSHSIWQIWSSFNAIKYATNNDFIGLVRFWTAQALGTESINPTPYIDKGPMPRRYLALSCSALQRVDVPSKKSYRIEQLEVKVTP